MGLLSKWKRVRVSLPSITKTPNGFLRFDTQILRQTTLGGGTVDATDLESVSGEPGCGFDSHPPCRVDQVQCGAARGGPRHT